MYNNSPGAQQQAWAEQQMYNSGGYGYGYGPGVGFMDNDGRGQELAYSQRHGHSHGISPDQYAQQQQYHQQFHGQDKSGFSQEIHEQPQQAPGQSQVFDPDQKGSHQWQ
jgi:hypothetical protein